MALSVGDTEALPGAGRRPGGRPALTATVSPKAVGQPQTRRNPGDPPRTRRSAAAPLRTRLPPADRSAGARGGCICRLRPGPDRGRPRLGPNGPRRRGQLHARPPASTLHPRSATTTRPAAEDAPARVAVALVEHLAALPPTWKRNLFQGDDITGVPAATSHCDDAPGPGTAPATSTGRTARPAPKRRIFAATTRDSAQASRLPRQPHPACPANVGPALYVAPLEARRVMTPVAPCQHVCGPRPAGLPGPQWEPWVLRG